MRHPFYFGYGLIVLAGLAFAEFSGWSLTRVNEIKQVPKSIRDNPGAYRSIYRSNPHYFGGK